VLLSCKPIKSISDGLTRCREASAAIRLGSFSACCFFSFSIFSVCSLLAWTRSRDCVGCARFQEMNDNVAYPSFCKACIDASTPVSSDHNITWNGVGGMFYGSRDRCPTCGSVVQSQWFCILFIPVFRVGRYRVKYVAPNRYLSRELPSARKRNPRRRRFSCQYCGCLGFHREDCPAKVK
jgi:hypothetical protein